MPLQRLDGETAVVELELTDGAQNTDEGLVYRARVNSVELDGAPQKFNIRLKTDSSLSVDYYQGFKAYVQFYSIADNAFDSYGYFGNNIFLSARLIESYNTVSQSRAAGYYFLKARLAVCNILEEAYSDDILGLTQGILLGDNSLISDESYASFKVCGITHITAVSGLHISVICLCLYKLLKISGCDKFSCTFIAVAVLLIYAGITGFSKSVIRAGIMISVLLISKLLNSKADGLNSLGLAVLFICFNPFAVSDASALLTVTSVLGAIVISPALEELYTPSTRPGSYVFGMVCVSVGILISTLPVLWLIFGYVSFISVFINIIVIPLAQVVLIGTVLYVLLSGAAFMAFIPKAVVKLSAGMIIGISKFCSGNFPFLCRRIDGSIFGIAISALLFFTAASLLLFYKVKIKNILAMICILFISVSLLNSFDISHNAYVLINSNGMVAAFDDENAVIIGMNSKSDYYDVCEIYSKNICFTHCEYCKAGIENASAAAMNISDDFTLYEENDEIILTLYNKTFKIDDDCVTINNEVYYRDINGKFSEHDDIILKISKG